MNCCVVGLQWGDEGKGKLVDILAAKSDIVVRYGGGANAGHTVVIEDEKFALHLLPSGAVRQGVICVIANGVVVDPAVLTEEIDNLASRGISLEGRLFISEAAHVVLDYHKAEDRLREEALGKDKIGTTARGIGPCYADKVGRSYAVRMVDFRDLGSLEAKIKRIVNYKNKIFAALYEAEPMDAGEIFAKCRLYRDKLSGFITDTTEYLHESIRAGKNILFEGAQGALLDLDHGTFPFVTSSNSCALGMGIGCGVTQNNVDKFIGVVKAYSTRVGSGPFPTEQDNEIGQRIRDRGHEYGTTTGRPRRCGWFDAVAVGYSARLGGVDEIAMMHLDTLAGFEQLKVCRAYNLDDKERKFFTPELGKLSRVECVYESFDGWAEEIQQVTAFDDLPGAARDYVAAVEELIGVKVSIVGVGPKRSQALFRG
jgi:adenylosuccinate synthase